MAVGGPAPGWAQSAPVTATIDPTVIGSRTVGAIADVALATGVDPGTMAAEFEVTVQETTRAGSPDWSLVVSATPLLAETGTTASGLWVDDRRAERTDSAGAILAPEGGSDLAQPALLFRQTGQERDRIHTGTHVSRSRLVWTVPNGTPVGDYHSTVTVTLVQ